MSRRLRTRVLLKTVWIQRVISITFIGTRPPATRPADAGSALVRFLAVDPDADADVACDLSGIFAAAAAVADGAAVDDVGTWSSRLK